MMDIEVMKKLLKKYTQGHVMYVQDAQTAERYYRNKTDILLPPLPGEKEEKEESPLRNADNRIPFNFHGLLVNQKAAYMFTAPPLFDVGSKTANKTLTKFLGDKYAKVCKDLCINASNCKIAWIHVWKDYKTNTYKYGVVPSMQIIPVWTDELEGELAGVIRWYPDINDEGMELDVYEYWNDRTCQTFAKEHSHTIDEGLMLYDAFTMIDTCENAIPTSEYEHEVGEVPFFPFFNNNTNTNDLENIKPLIDTYCKVFSGFVNDMDDIQEVVFVLTNYGGADMHEFLSDMKKYKTIKIDSDGDDSSGVQTLNIEIPVEARKELLTITRKCIFEQGQGIDPDPQNFGNSSGVALNFLYSLLELKAGLQETEFKLSFGRFIRCICRLLNVKIKDDTIVQTWTRTSVKNDLEEAQIAAQSKNIIPDEDIIRKHPWVEDPEKSINEYKEQQNAGSGVLDMFPKSTEDDDNKENIDE